MSQDHDLVSVHTCANGGEAEIIIGLLKTNDIEALRESDMPHSVYSINADAQILANNEDEAEALRIISEHEDRQEGGAEA